MSNERISNEDFRSFAGEFKNESDRAAVVLAAAKLDYFLRATLESFLLPCSTGDDELLESMTGPLKGPWRNAASSEAKIVEPS